MTQPLLSRVVNGLFDALEFMNRPFSDNFTAAPLAGCVGFPSHTAPLLGEEGDRLLSFYSNPLSVSFSQAEQVIPAPDSRLYEGRDNASEIAVIDRFHLSQGSQAIQNNRHLLSVPSQISTKGSTCATVAYVLHYSSRLKKDETPGAGTPNVSDSPTFDRQTRELGTNGSTINTSVAFFNRQPGFSMGLTVRTMRPGLRVRRRFNDSSAISIPFQTSCSRHSAGLVSRLASNGAGSVNFSTLLPNLFDDLGGSN